MIESRNELVREIRRWCRLPLEKNPYARRMLQPFMIQLEEKRRRYLFAANVEDALDDLVPELRRLFAITKKTWTPSAKAAKDIVSVFARTPLGSHGPLLKDIYSRTLRAAAAARAELTALDHLADDQIEQCHVRVARATAKAEKKLCNFDAGMRKALDTAPSLSTPT